jgi:hypothetical protein
MKHYFAKRALYTAGVVAVLQPNVRRGIRRGLPKAFLGYNIIMLLIFVLAFLMLI